MSDLSSVVYVSTAVKPMHEAELEALLIEARQLNEETQTTGVLLYSEGSFMQCFEGTHAAVTVTYERIRSSRRHTGLIELLNEPIAERSFADWQMGFMWATRAELLALSSARWQRQADEGDEDSAALQLLKQFWERARR